jgi:hypothetical protein
MSASDVETLAGWVDTISYTTFCLLDGAGEEEAFSAYDPNRKGPTSGRC